MTTGPLLSTEPAPIASLMQSLIPAIVSSLAPTWARPGAATMTRQIRSANLRMRPPSWQPRVCASIRRSVVEVELGRSIFRFHLYADAFEEGGRENSAGAYDHRVVSNPDLVPLLLDFDVVAADPLDA